MGKYKFNKNLKYFSPEKGSLLILALLITVILVILGYAVTSMIGIEGEHAAIAEYSTQSLYAADSGVQFAMSELVNSSMVNGEYFRIIGKCTSGGRFCVPGTSCCVTGCTPYPPPPPFPSAGSPQCGCPNSTTLCTSWPQNPISANPTTSCKYYSPNGLIWCSLSQTGNIENNFEIALNGYEGNVGGCKSPGSNAWCYQVQSTGTVENSSGHIFSQRVLKAYLKLTDNSVYNVSIIDEFEVFH
ncbi:MAG: hypothetical protein M1169_06045 [Firmicutes bacterium]|jgi:hypothetical protein|nr:hypothetical protein [Bacillota bacterium]